MKSAMAVVNFISENYLVIIAFLAVGAGAVIKIKKFMNKSAVEQKEILKGQADNLTKAIKAGLLSMVTIAEKKFGAKTGQVKQSDVYNEVIKAFPKLTEYIENGIIDADFIKSCIDESVDAFNELRKKNSNLESIVTNAPEMVEVPNDTEADK